MRCFLCPKMIPTWSFYRQHLNNAHDAPMMMCCKMCGFETESRDDMKSHYQRHHPDYVQEGKRLTYEAASKPYTFRWRNDRSRIEERGARVYQRRAGQDERRGDRRRENKKSGRQVQEEEKKTTDRKGEMRNEAGRRKRRLTGRRERRLTERRKRRRLTS